MFLCGYWFCSLGVFIVLLGGLIWLLNSLVFGGI